MTTTKKENGFTLIELLIVVIVIGLLSGVLISIIDPVRSQGQARDSVRYNNIKNISEGIESFRQVEGYYPATADPTTSTSLLRTVYLKNWPVGYDNSGNVNEAVWGYRYARPSATGFVIYVPISTTGCYKYQTTWKKVKVCPVAQCNTNVSAMNACN